MPIGTVFAETVTYTDYYTDTVIKSDFAIFKYMYSYNVPGTTLGEIRYMFAVRQQMD